MEERPDINRLIADHHTAVYRYAYRLAGSVADAEDLTQQAFLLAQVRLHQLREPDKARGWLYAVLRSVYLKGRRKQAPVPAGSLELNVNLLAEPAAPAEGFDREQLQGALNGLPDDFKVVLLMYYFEDCSYKEIAEKLELPMGTVMSRLSRAKGRLRELLSVGPDARPAETQQVARPAASGNGSGRKSDAPTAIHPAG